MADRAESLSFDRIADRYDATRGGDLRGRAVAAELLPHLRPGRVLEVGVGTGLVASALREQGVDVVGIDLSPEMLRRAVQRIGPRVAVGDALHLPVRSASVPVVAVVWVLHLVEDVRTALAEFARVTEPGGRCLVVPAGSGTGGSTDVEVLGRRMWEVVQPDGPTDAADRVISLATGAGLPLAQRREFPGAAYPMAPAELARRMEERLFSGLWGLSEEAFAAQIRPLVDAVRALPEQDRPRHAQTAYELLVFDRP